MSRRIEGEVLQRWHSPFHIFPDAPTSDSVRFAASDLYEDFIYRVVDPIWDTWRPVGQPVIWQIGALWHGTGARMLSSLDPQPQIRESVSYLNRLVVTILEDFDDA